MNFLKFQLKVGLTTSQWIPEVLLLQQLCLSAFLFFCYPRPFWLTSCSLYLYSLPRWSPPVLYIYMRMTPKFTSLVSTSFLDSTLPCLLLPSKSFVQVTKIYPVDNWSCFLTGLLVSTLAQYRIFSAQKFLKGGNQWVLVICLDTFNGFQFSKSYFRHGLQWLVIYWLPPSLQPCCLSFLPLLEQAKNPLLFSGLVLLLA